MERVDDSVPLRPLWKYVLRSTHEIPLPPRPTLNRKTGCRPAISLTSSQGNHGSGHRAIEVERRLVHAASGISWRAVAATHEANLVAAGDGVRAVPDVPGRLGAHPELPF
jgi:hypothetical protein